MERTGKGEGEIEGANWEKGGSFHPFFTIPIITLAFVKIEQKSIVHLKINYNWMEDIRGAHFLPTKCDNKI